MTWFHDRTLTPHEKSLEFDAGLRQTGQGMPSDENGFVATTADNWLEVMKEIFGNEQQSTIRRRAATGPEKEAHEDH